MNMTKQFPLCINQLILILIFFLVVLMYKGGRIIYILFVSFPLIILRHFILNKIATKTTYKKKNTNSLMILINAYITITIFFSSFFILDFDKDVNDSFNSIKMTVYFSIYYILNILLLSYKMYKNNGKINIVNFENLFSKYRVEIYVFALVINFLIIIFKNTFVQSMYNAFTFIIVLDTLTILLLKIFKNYINK